jgi:AcrR family transcriptional regulator
VRHLLPLVREGAGPADPDRTPVLDAALDAFLDFGVRRTSMGEVARRSRLSPATLYRRFAQKSDLVTAVGLREVRRLLAEVDRRIDMRATAEDQIVELFVACFEGMRENRLLNRLLSTEPEIVLPRLTLDGGPVIELGRDYLAEFLRRLQRTGDLPDYDPEPVAEVLARVALSLALTRGTTIPLHQGERTRRFVLDHVAAFVGLSGPGGDPRPNPGGPR